MSDLFNLFNLWFTMPVVMRVLQLSCRVKIIDFVIYLRFMFANFFLPKTAQLNSPFLWTDWDWWMRVGFALPWRLCGRCWLPQGWVSGCCQSMQPPSPVGSQKPCRLGTKENFRNAADGTKNICFVLQLCITPNIERAVVSSVNDEAVHVRGDGQVLRVSGTVPGTGILKQNTLSFLHQCH